MNDLELQFHLQSLSTLPPGHADRAQLDELLATLPQEDRMRWLDLRRESDLLHGAMGGIATPENLQTKLLAIPETAKARAAKTRRKLYLYAACLLILLPFAIYGIMDYLDQPATPTYTYGEPLAAQTASQIADLAVKTHEAPPPLLITSADPTAVAGALQTTAMPFPTMVPAPQRKLTLLGGGICDFGPTKAIFTRWQDGSNICTVYQFDGTPFHVPANFQSMVAAAKSDRVFLWPAPGNKCTWAAVIENPTAGNPFYY